MLATIIKASLVIIFGVSNDWLWLISLGCQWLTLFLAGDCDNAANYSAYNLGIRWAFLLQAHATDGDKSIHMSDCCDSARGDFDIPQC